MSLDLESFKILYNYDTHQLIIKQYLDLQYKYQDNIIFFRIGEFYEIFFDQAKLVAEVASINLTTKFGVKMCGIPYASINLYAGKLVDAGYSIAVAEQINDNGNSDANSKNNNKKILSRSVVKIITPGTFIDREIASSSLSQYLLSFSVENNIACIVYIDLHTGEFIIEDTEAEILYSRIKSIEPKEILLAESQEYNANIHSICLVSRLKINDSIKLSYEKLLEIFHLSSDESIKNINCNIRKRCITNILHYIYNINQEVDIRKQGKIIDY
ncbi:MAG: hypothetical protein EB127_13800 [Alphaproteobacteria bacterium]|nr:hypothetical protein [Alphaproteobacteria bacterium]